MSEKTEQTFSELTGNLTGLTKWVAAKALNSGFADEAKRINGRDALKKLVDKAVQKAASAIRLKIAIILSIVVCILAIVATAAVLAGGGSAIIPIAVSVILIAIVWFATGIMSKLIAGKTSGVIFKAIEGKVSNINGGETK